MPTIQITKTMYSEFCKQPRPEGLRLGQHFHQHFSLNKCVRDKDFCDVLYYADEDKAKSMIEAILDRSN